MAEIIISHRPGGIKLTRFEFLERFTLPEMVAIEAAGETDAEVRTIIRLFQISEKIDLTNDRLNLSMDILVSKGLLTQERRDEIMKI